MILAIIYQIESGYEVRSINSGGVGYGDTIPAAIKDMCDVLQANHDAAESAGVPMLHKPTAADKALFFKIDEGFDVADNIHAVVKFKHNGKKWGSTK